MGRSRGADLRIGILKSDPLKKYLPNKTQSRATIAWRGEGYLTHI
jgi:hypothetical protein